MVGIGRGEDIAQFLLREGWGRAPHIGGLLCGVSHR